MHNATYLCSGVTFRITDDLAPPSACQCSQRRKQSGHYWSSNHIPVTDLLFTAKDSLRWYKASDTAKRGFCPTCGSFLFWKHKDEDKVFVAMETLAGRTGAQLARQKLTADVSQQETS